MDLVGIEIFARVVEARSFSGAAARLGISKSAVSKHVSRMEKSMGVRLLNRTTRNLSVTEIGKEWYERCAQILVQAEEAEALVAHLQAEPRGLLKVNVPVAFGVLHIASRIAELLIDWPQLRIEMTLNDRTVNLADEGYDACVVIDKNPNPAFVARKLAPIRRKLCATAAYFERHGLPAKARDLAGHNCLVYSRLGTEKDWCFDGPDGEEWIPVGGNLRLNNENAIRQAALSGLGIALLKRIEDQFITAAKVVAKIGYDFIDLKQCHRYLLSELLASKNRAGEYGGSLENRTRLVRNVVGRIRDELPQLVIATRMNAYDGIPYRGG